MENDLTPVTKNQFSHHVDVELVAHVEVNEAYDEAIANLRDRKPVLSKVNNSMPDREKEAIAKAYCKYQLNFRHD